MGVMLQTHTTIFSHVRVQQGRLRARGLSPLGTFVSTQLSPPVLNMWSLTNLECEHESF